MSTLRDNLRCDIMELLEKCKRQTISIYDINVKLPETLTNTLALFENKDLSVSASKSLQRNYPVFINGTKNYCTEAQVTKLRQKTGDVNMLLDMPRLTLTVHLPHCKEEFDFEKFPYPTQKIIEWGMTCPGELLNQNNLWSRDTLKRYIFSTRQLLKDNKDQYIIKTSRDSTSMPGSYYFNPRIKYIVIKNLESTLGQPSINKSVLQ